METIYDVMKDRLQVTETTVMVTVLSGPRQGDKTIYAEDGRVLYGTPIEGFTVDKAKLNSLCMVGEMECFVQPVENDPSVLVLGAGHVSRAITDLLLFIGCRVTVVDDRPEYVVPEFFDERVTRKCLPLENFKNDLPLDEYNGFIIVTRAHEYDNICLEQLRGYLPTYMGVMGSQKRIHHAFEVLREQGWTQDELDMVYAPIGLDLGAQTPEEIALSIVSEYLAVVRGKKGGSLRKGRVIHREFIEYLSERKNETLAVATILYTCGSTPRKAGTSMVVFPDGSIFGTIGGGRAENEIRLSAVDSLNKKEAHRRIDVHLDDDVAVKEGMVCGGQMDVWIETQNI